MVMPGNRSCNETFKHKGRLQSLVWNTPTFHNHSPPCPRPYHDEYEVENVHPNEPPRTSLSWISRPTNPWGNQSMTFWDCSTSNGWSMDVGWIPNSSSCAICYLQCQGYCIRSFLVTLQTQLPHLLHCCRRAALVDDWILDPLLHGNTAAIVISFHISMQPYGCFQQ